ncbi:MAG: response regulator [Candidatus Omnitrophota bacterium]
MDEVKILVVEDERGVLEVIKNCLLRFVQAQVFEADNAEEAIRVMKENDLDLVILDIKMPGKSGIDVMREVKETKELPDILVVTAYDSAAVAAQVIKEGAVDYMTKPIVAETLMLKVENILSPKGKYLEKK